MAANVLNTNTSFKILLIFQEPGEAAHKFLRRWQTSHAHQMKIEDRNIDVMHRMLERYGNTGCGVFKGGIQD